MLCFHCQTDNIVTGLVGRGDNCTKCFWSLRVCKNCEHYDLKAYNECREPSAERVVDKEKSNFCDFFKPGTKNSASSDPNRLDPRAAAEALFKKR